MILQAPVSVRDIWVSLVGQNIYFFFKQPRATCRKQTRTHALADWRLAGAASAALQTPIVSMVIVRKPFQYLREPITDMCPHCRVGNLRIAAAQSLG